MSSELHYKEIERERHYGKVIMAIDIICKENKLEPYIHSADIIVSVEQLQLWTGFTTEEISEINEICHLLAIKMISSCVIREEGEKDDEWDISIAKEKFKLKLQERIKYVQEKYDYPFDVIKHAIPFSYAENFFGHIYFVEDRDRIAVEYISQEIYYRVLTWRKDRNEKEEQSISK